MRELMLIISAVVFSAIFLVSIIVLGNHHARTVAIFASFIATVSQFSGQDSASCRISIYSAYAAFIAALIAFILFAWGL